MTRKAIALSLLVLGLALAGCNARTDRSEGSVLLSVADFESLPARVSVTQGPFEIDGLVVRNIPKDPSGNTSELQSVELRSYEIRYTRRDTGRRVPPALVQSIFSVVPVGGQITIDNLPIMLTNQLGNAPLKDLADFGADQETGTAVIVLNCSLRFFGRTLSGDNITSAPATFTIEVVP
jgi:hypothetical protein